jgi:hypothetical protein
LWMKNGAASQSDLESPITVLDPVRSTSSPEETA